MTESDDSLLGGGGGVDIPDPVTAGNVQRTAEPIEQLTDLARKNRNRRRAAAGAGARRREPKLSIPGLLGIPEEGI